jgi:hypothetical protein
MGDKGATPLPLFSMEIALTDVHATLPSTSITVTVLRKKFGGQHLLLLFALSKCNGAQEGTSSCESWSDIVRDRSFHNMKLKEREYLRYQK